MEKDLARKYTQTRRLILQLRIFVVVAGVVVAAILQPDFFSFKGLAGSASHGFSRVILYSCLILLGLYAVLLPFAAAMFLSTASTA